jgi:GNAT superfamily N-acetyltransferase
MNDYTIRKAVPGELEDLYTIFSLADNLHREAHPEIFQEVSDPSDIKDYFKTRIQSDDSVVFIAEVRSKIIGAVIASIRQTPDYSLLIPRILVSVENLIVVEEFRHQGVGLALMKRIHLWASERDLKHIELTVWDFNEGAQAFYKNMGYEMLHHRMHKELQ